MAADSPHPAAPRRTPPATVSTDQPAQVGRYRILRRLGAGGMGTVYLAEDPRLQRAVALKVLVKSEHTPPNLVRRFHAETQTSAKLRHPNIVTVFDSGESEGHLYLALEYIDGPDIERVIRKRGRIPVERTIEIIRQVAHALDHAHSLGVVHRDIKPSNILLRRDGTATLTDLGLARAVDETAASGITRAGFTVGTVDYMAPEQARSSKAADARSDLYSLGCTWFHMLAGRVPFSEGDLTNKLRAHAQEPPPDPRDVDPEIPAGVVAVLQRLMAKRPDDRYQTPAELLADLDRPGLCRKSVTADDLRSLADEAKRTGPIPVLPAAAWSDDETVPAGSTVIEKGRTPAVPPRPAAPIKSPQRSSRGSAPKNAAPKKAASAAAPFKKADQIRAAVVLGGLVVVLAVAIWALSQLDQWFGGSPPQAPTLHRSPHHGIHDPSAPQTPPLAETPSNADGVEIDGRSPAGDETTPPGDVPMTPGN